MKVGWDPCTPKLSNCHYIPAFDAPFQLIFDLVTLAFFIHYQVILPAFAWSHTHTHTRDFVKCISINFLSASQNVY